jgi:hypothetical protein
VIFDWSKLSDSRVTHKRDSLGLWTGDKRQFRDYAPMVLYARAQLISTTFSMLFEYWLLGLFGQKSALAVTMPIVTAFKFCIGHRKMGS